MWVIYQQNLPMFGSKSALGDSYAMCHSTMHHLCKNIYCVTLLDGDCIDLLISQDILVYQNLLALVYITP